MSRTVYCKRDTNGNVVGWTRWPTEGFSEKITEDHPDVLAYKKRKEIKREEAARPRLSPEMDALMGVLDLAPEKVSELRRRLGIA